ncbi:MAG: hypothetical protein ACYCSS_08545 [Sulfuriferula sp.]
MNNIDEQFAIIKKARHIVNQLAEVKNPTTQRDYLKTAERLIALSKSPMNHANTGNSFYKYSAAWKYYWREELRKLLMQANHQQQTDRTAWNETITTIMAVMAVLEPYLSESLNKHTWRKRKGDIEKTGLVVKSHSKRKTIRRLPDSWRHDVFGLAVSKCSKYISVIATLSLTGCRPAEIVKGVLFELRNDGVLSVTIQGAKRHGGKYGAEWRSFDLQDDGSDAFQHIKKLCIETNSELIANSCLVLYPAAKVSETVRTLVKNTKFEKKVSAYSFRHQLTADVKALGFDAADTARMLGHCTDRSQTYYSAACKNGGGRKIMNVKSSTDPVMKNDAALKKMQQKMLEFVHLDSNPR